MDGYEMIGAGGVALNIDEDSGTWQVIKANAPLLRTVELEYMASSGSSCILLFRATCN
jgi:hypothetical protein